MRLHQRSLARANSCRLLEFLFEPEPKGGIPETVCPSWPFALVTCVVAENSTVAISNQNLGFLSYTPPSSTSDPARESSTRAGAPAAYCATSQCPQTSKQRSL